MEIGLKLIFTSNVENNEYNKWTITGQSKKIFTTTARSIFGGDKLSNDGTQGQCFWGQPQLQENPIFPLLKLWLLLLKYLIIYNIIIQGAA